MGVCPQLREPMAGQCLQAELFDEGVQALGGAVFFMAGVFGEDEFVFQAVFPAHQFGDGDFVAH